MFTIVVRCCFTKRPAKPSEFGGVSQEVSRPVYKLPSHNRAENYTKRPNDKEKRGQRAWGSVFFSIKVVGFDIFCISLPVRFIKIYTLNLFVCRSNSVCVIFERFDCLVGRGFLL